jgi:hypothetical protein
MGKALHQMRVNSKDELVWDRLTWWEGVVHRWASFWGLPRRTGVVMREVCDE